MPRETDEIMTDIPTTRRAALTAVLGGAAAFATPALAKGLTEWRMVTSWPKNLPGPGISTERLAQSIGRLSDGRLTIKVFAAGELVDPAHPDGGANGSVQGLLCDAFGNTEIGLLVDRNGDGLVKPGDDGTVSAVTGVQGGVSSMPAEADLPAAGVRAGVLIYSAGRGASQSDLILSWK